MLLIEWNMDMINQPNPGKRAMLLAQVSNDINDLFQKNKYYETKYDDVKDGFKGSLIHDKAEIIKLLDKLDPEQMHKIVELLQLLQNVD